MNAEAIDPRVFSATLALTSRAYRLPTVIEKLLERRLAVTNKPNLAGSQEGLALTTSPASARKASAFQADRSCSCVSAIPAALGD